MDFHYWHQSRRLVAECVKHFGGLNESLDGFRYSSSVDCKEENLYPKRTQVVTCAQVTKSLSLRQGIVKQVGLQIAAERLPAKSALSVRMRLGCNVI